MIKEELDYFFFTKHIYLNNGPSSDKGSSSSCMCVAQKGNLDWREYSAVAGSIYVIIACQSVSFQSYRVVEEELNERNPVLLAVVMLPFSSS
jgi:hypothetical protein